MNFYHIFCVFAITGNWDCNPGNIETFVALMKRCPNVITNKDVVLILFDRNLEYMIIHSVALISKVRLSNFQGLHVFSVDRPGVLGNIILCVRSIVKAC